jgi:galactonate dehydratase
VVATAGIAPGLGLSVTLVGIPLLLPVVVGSRYVAPSSGGLANAPLAVDVPRPRDVPDPERDGVWLRICAILSARSTWLAVAFLYDRFALGLAPFALVALAVVVTVVLLTAPLHDADPSVGLSIGVVRIDTLPRGDRGRPSRRRRRGGLPGRLRRGRAVLRGGGGDVPRTRRTAGFRSPTDSPPTRKHRVPQPPPGRMRVVDYELYPLPRKSQLLKLETDTGLVGWGEPVVEGKAESTGAAVRELLEGYLLGEDPLPIEHHWQRLYRGGFYRGGPVLMAAIAGVDQALWDLKGKHYDLPAHELLGGRARDRVQLYQHVHGETPAEHAEAARQAVAEGFEVLKTSPKQPFRRVDTPAAIRRTAETLGAIREAVGDDVAVGVDFHGRVAKPTAKRLAAALEPHDPMFYEEPVLPEHNEALGPLAAHTTVPIATGERMFSRWEFKPLLESGAADVLQPDVSHAGGITEVKKIADMAEAYDVALAPHCPLGPVALAACLQVDACAPNALVQEQVVHRGEFPDWVDNPTLFDYEAGGYLPVPDGPGLGVEIDEDALAAAVAGDAEAWAPPQWTHEDGSVAEW